MSSYISFLQCWLHQGFLLLDTKSLLVGVRINPKPLPMACKTQTCELCFSSTSDVLARVRDLLIPCWAMVFGASGPLHMLFSLLEAPSHVSVLHNHPLLSLEPLCITFLAESHSTHLCVCHHPYSHLLMGISAPSPGLSPGLRERPVTFISVPLSPSAGPGLHHTLSMWLQNEHGYGGPLGVPALAGDLRGAMPSSAVLVTAAVMELHAPWGQMPPHTPSPVLFIIAPVACFYR